MSATAPGQYTYGMFISCSIELGMIKVLKSRLLAAHVYLGGRYLPIQLGTLPIVFEILAATREDLSSGFVAERDSYQSTRLQRLV